MVGWHPQLNGCEFEQAPGDSERQESLVHCSPWGCRVRHDSATELNSHLALCFLRFNQPFNRPCGTIVSITEKYPYMSETIEFKIMFFKGHLYAPFHRYTHHSKFYITAIHMWLLAHIITYDFQSGFSKIILGFPLRKSKVILVFTSSILS